MKTTILKISIVFLLFSLMGAGCEKSNETNILTGNGLILYYGDPAVDGCGWVIEVKDTTYYPTNLDPKFQKDNLEVTVNYRILSSTWNCGWRDPGYQEIELSKINLKNGTN